MREPCTCCNGWKGDMSRANNKCRPDIREIVTLAKRAGEAIIEVYEHFDLEVEIKGDGSPLTLADRRSHECIEKGLLQLTPEIPLLSEESAQSVLENRFHWNRFWLVDPLDGTREFLRRNHEFTVNIALIEEQQPVWGVVHTPVTGITYYGIRSEGAFCQRPDGTEKRIVVRKRDPRQTVMAVSRSHAGANVRRYRQNLERIIGPVTLAHMGSSLKICLVAEGKADVYPRLSPTSEWDTAAAHCVLEAAGGRMMQTDGSPLIYNKPAILNPWFLACGDPGVDWYKAAGGIRERE